MAKRSRRCYDQGRMARIMTARSVPVFRKISVRLRGTVVRSEASVWALLDYRRKMLLTCTAVQSPPRAVRTPRAVRALATPRRPLTPLAWISLMDGPDVGGERISGLATGFVGRLAGCGEAGAAKLDAAALGGGQGGLGALADRCPLVLGDGGEDVDGEPVGVRVVGGDELDVAVHQGGDEGEIAGQAVEFGNDQLGLVLPARGQGLLELPKCALMRPSAAVWRGHRISRCR